MVLVYCVYIVYGDGDGYPLYDLEFVCDSLASAKEVSLSLLLDYNASRPKNLVHSTMSADNNYTYIGKREDCSDSSCYGFGGIIIEETPLTTNKLA